MHHFIEVTVPENVLLNLAFLEQQQVVNGPSEHRAQGSKKQGFSQYAKGHYCGNFYHSYRAQNTRMDTHMTRKPLFPNWKQKKTIAKKNLPL